MKCTCPMVNTASGLQRAGMDIYCPAHGEPAPDAASRAPTTALVGITSTLTPIGAQRALTLARFIRGQAALTDDHPHKPGPGNVKLNHEEALLCADALEAAAALTSIVQVPKVKP